MSAVELLPVLPIQNRCAIDRLSPLVPQSAAQAGPEPVKRNRLAKPPPRLQQRVQLDETLSQSESENSGDDSQNPEWVRTPLYKRINKMTVGVGR